MAPSADQKKEFPVLSVVGLLLVLVLVAAGFWIYELVESNKFLKDAKEDLNSLGNDRSSNDFYQFERHSLQQTQCFQGAVVGLLLIVCLISARGHIFRPMHL